MLWWELFACFLGRRYWNTGRCNLWVKFFVFEVVCFPCWTFPGNVFRIKLYRLANHTLCAHYDFLAPSAWWDVLSNGRVDKSLFTWSAWPGGSFTTPTAWPGVSSSLVQLNCWQINKDTESNSINMCFGEFLTICNSPSNHAYLQAFLFLSILSNFQ